MSLVKTHTIRMRRLIEVNTDPQRRCYNGCHAKSELHWTDWETLNSNVIADKVEDKLKFWRDLNAYAISQRGPSALCEFEAVQDVAEPMETYI